MLTYNTEDRCDPVKKYANSKLMLSAFSQQLQTHLDDLAKGVVSNVVDPGATATEFVAPVAPSRRMGFGPQVLVQKFLGYLLAPLRERVVKSFKRSPVTAAQAILHVATSPHLAEAGGRSFADTASAFTRSAGCKRAPEDCGRTLPLPAMQQDSDLADLWEDSTISVQPWSKPLLSAKAI
jgi:NAD(P)-dependent dehydrogenase (short-subunit alcohol dehydrogenase family)